MYKRTLSIVPLITLMIVSGLVGFVNAVQTKNQKDERRLTPLTDAERALNAKNIVANQPDFVADESFFYAESEGGMGGAEHIARKGNVTRWDNGYVVVIQERGKAATRLYKNKTYNDIEEGVGDSVNAGFAFDPRILAAEDKTTFAALGTVIVDGHKCLVIRAVRDGGEEATLYAAIDLKYLIISAKVVRGRTSSVQRLSNISFDVPDSLFHPPSDYRPVEHFLWKRIENATIYYNGKSSTESCAFRSPTGEIFVRVANESYPWEYLVRPNEGTSEVVFQGLLKTRTGEYAWRTQEKEVYSTPFDIPTGRRRYICNEDDCPKMIVTPNSIEFASDTYHKNKAKIRITW